MKFGQLKEYKMRNIFLEKSYAKYGEENSSKLLKNQNSAYAWINNLKFYTVCFFICQVQGCLKILKLSFRPFTFTSYKAFLKNKKRSGNSLPVSFSA